MSRRALLGISGQQTPPVPPITLGYVSGMTMLLDGIENSLTGHQTSLTIWQDLSKNGNDIAVPSSAAINNNNVETNPARLTAGVDAMTVLGGLKINNHIVSQFEEFTIEMRVTIADNISNYAVVFHSRSYGTANQDVGVHRYQTTLRQGLNSNWLNIANVSPTTISFVYKKSANTLTIYQNGNLSYNRTGVSTGVEAIFNGDLTFGAFEKGISATNILFHNIRFYPKALTPQEISSNYNNDINRGLTQIYENSNNNN